GPGLWTGGQGGCEQLYPVVCLGRTRTAALEMPATAGKRIWVTDTTFVPGSMTPDAKCVQERPAGVTQARALLAYTGRTAAELLDPEANYVRPDGQLVGTGAQIAAQQLLTGPWVTASNQSSTFATWAGAATLTTPGTVESTCNDWASRSGTSPTGISNSVMGFWSRFEDSCDSPRDLALYCIEP
ncbi:MAG TPA: hypothetical protein VNN80_25895, partial [Polyangiaceae bacterium]|nr:hypothetical protein [Polyangiaceae bacterium]